MKKYWKIIMISVVSIFSIGTFYINSVISAVELPEFVIESQSGDERLVDSIIVDGSYHQNPISKSFRMTSIGTVYYSELSFWEQLNGMQHPMIEQLIEEHRSFMRGKSQQLRSFYEDEQFLVTVKLN